MNRLQYRHAFAMRYFERTGNYMVGWALSKAAADRARRAASHKRMKAVIETWPPRMVCAVALGSIPGVFRYPGADYRLPKNQKYTDGI